MASGTCCFYSVKCGWYLRYWTYIVCIKQWLWEHCSVNYDNYGVNVLICGCHYRLYINPLHVRQFQLIIRYTSVLKIVHGPASIGSNVQCTLYVEGYMLDYTDLLWIELSHTYINMLMASNFILLPQVPNLVFLSWGGRHNKLWHFFVCWQFLW